MIDARHKGEINLDINRAVISSRKCAHPLCIERSNLRRVPIQTRYNVIKKQRFYIPQRALSCNLHRDESTWLEIETFNADIPFSNDQIEDMVDLLRLEPKSLNYVLPGIWFEELIVFRLNTISILQYILSVGKKIRIAC